MQGSAPNCRNVPSVVQPAGGSPVDLIRVIALTRQVDR